VTEFAGSGERAAARGYGKVAKTLHWVVAGLFVWAVVLAWMMVDMPANVEKFRAYNLHKTLGLTILALMIARLVWRRLRPPPPAPDTLSPIERRLATGMHHLLYLAVIAQASVGLLHSWTAGFPVMLFNAVALPDPLPANKTLEAVFAAAHHWLGWLLIALVVGHVTAALRHHFVLRDDVLRRMLPSWRRPER